MLPGDCLHSYNNNYYTVSSCNSGLNAATELISYSHINYYRVTVANWFVRKMMENDDIKL